MLRRGKTREVAAFADSLERNDALRAEGFLLRGHLAAAGGNVADAKRCFRAAAEALPGDTEMLDVICRFLFERGTPAEVEPYQKALVHLRPD